MDCLEKNNGLSYFRYFCFEVPILTSFDNDRQSMLTVTESKVARIFSYLRRKSFIPKLEAALSPKFHLTLAGAVQILQNLGDED